jgi:hypothetical protein
MDDNSVSLFVMNIIVIVLFGLTLAFVIITYRNNVLLLTKQREDINKVILYIRYFDNILVELLLIIQKDNEDLQMIKEKALEVKNLMDLDEFRGISPELKEKYKKYVVDQLMTSFAAVVNRNSTVSPGKDMISDDKLSSIVTKLIANINSS